MIKLRILLSKYNDKIILTQHLRKWAVNATREQFKELVKSWDENAMKLLMKKGSS